MSQPRELPAGVEPVLSREEAALFLRCSVSHLDRLVHQLQLPCFDIAPHAQRRVLRFCPRQLRRWAQERRNRKTSECISSKPGPQGGGSG